MAIGENSPISLSPKQIAIIARLAASSNGRCSRTELASLLWPTSSARSARHSLSQALYLIRAATSASAIGADVNDVWLGAIRTDVREFEAALADERYALAGGYYRGPFLSAPSLNGCVAFSQWTDATRARYSSMAEEVLEALANDEHWESALSLASTLLATNPGSTRINALRLAALSKVKGPSAVQVELTDLPFAERAAIDALSHQIVDTAERESPKAGGFAGRKSELLRLDSEAESVAATASARIVALEGDAGIGKTALATRFAKRRVLRGDIALMARASEPEQNVPFGVVEQWIKAVPHRLFPEIRSAQWWNVLRNVFPSLSASHPPELDDPLSQRQLFVSLRHLFVSLSKHNTLIISIDDVHLADNASVAFISYLCSAGVQAPILIVHTRRTGTPDPLQGLADTTNVCRIHIGPLTGSDVAQWLSKVGCGPTTKDPEFLAKLVSRTGGNPLLIASLLDDKIDPADGGLPRTVIEHYRPKLLQLSPIGRSTLAALAIFDEAATDAMLASLLDLNPAATDGAISEVIEAKLAIRGDDGGVRLQHGLIGEAALLMTADAEKRRLHGRTARIIERRDPAGAAMAAVSHDIAGNRQAAYTAALQAADACAVLNAQEERLFFLKLAIANAPDHESNLRARIPLSEVLLRLGRAHDSTEVLKVDLEQNCERDTAARAQIQRIKSGLTLTTSTNEVNAYWKRAKELVGQAQTTDVAGIFSEIGSVAHDLGADELASEVISEVRRLVEQLPKSIERSELLLRPIKLAGIIGDCTQAFAELEQLSPAEEGSAEYACKLHATRGTLLASAGLVAAASDQFGDALFIAERHGLYDHLCLAHNNLGVCLTEKGQFEHAENVLIRAQQYGSPETSPTQYSVAADNMVILFYESQRYDDALQAASESVSIRKSQGRRSYIHSLSMIGLSQLSLGRLGKAREAHREARIVDPDSDAISGDASYIHLFNARMMVASEEPRAAIRYLESKATEHKGVLALSRWRLELEACRLRLLLSLPLPRIDDLVAELEPTGAMPLLDLAKSCQRRYLIAQSR